jgi:glycosyltransferase involved in cell wall biosynthesis
MRKWLEERGKSGSLDILHNHGMWQFNALYPGWAAKKGNVPYVVSPRGSFSKWAMQHGSKAKKLFWPLMQKPALAGAACFHATSDAEYTEIRGLGFKQPVAVIPNGIDIPKIETTEHGTIKRLLFLGRIHPKKGLDLLLPTWRALQDHHREWQLVIVGSDSGFHGSTGYLGQMRRLAEDLQLERIEFAGELTGREKMNAYRSADLFVLPTYSENFGVSVAEALAAATPVVVTKGAPWAGLETHGAGWWCDVGIDSLTATLEKALALSSAELKVMGRRGRAWMEDEYSWNRVACMMDLTYKWLRGTEAEPPSWVRLD